MPISTSTVSPSGSSVSLDPGKLQPTNTSPQGTGPSATNDHSARRLAPGIIAIIAVFSALGALALLAGLVFVIRKRQQVQHLRGMAPLREDNGSPLPAITTPYFLSDNRFTLAANYDQDIYSAGAQAAAGRPTTPNFFTASPFGGGQPEATQNPFLGKIDYIPARFRKLTAWLDNAVVSSFHPPAQRVPSPWVSRTPRSSSTMD